MHHLALWSQNHLCQWWSGSGVRKSEGLASGQSCQNGWWTPLRLNHFASGRYELKSQGSMVTSISISHARVVDTIWGSCWKALPNCLYVVIVTGDAWGLIPAYIRALGVYDSWNEWCKAISTPTERVQHHDPNFSGYLQVLHNKINAFMDKVILKDTTYFPILLEEFWCRKNSKEHECTMRHFY